ncbi:glycogen/starch synthase [Candidatus Gracilibacteria bacterium]|nr:glycogen/starch synthase [Candidatus Gracilibacteria bacterium]
MKPIKSSTTRKRILILSWELFPLFLGGLGILARDIVKELDRQGAKVTVLLPYIPKDIQADDGISLDKSVRKYLKKKLPIKNLDFDLQVFDTSKKSQAKSWPQLFLKKKGVDKIAFKLYPNNTPAIAKAFAWSVYDYIKENNFEFDAIIGMDWQTIPACFCGKKKKVAIPFFFHMNSIEMDRSPNLNSHTNVQKSIIDLEKRGMQNAHKIFCVSLVTKKALGNTVKCQLKKL